MKPLRQPACAPSPLSVLPDQIFQEKIPAARRIMAKPLLACKPNAEIAKELRS